MRFPKKKRGKSLPVDMRKVATAALLAALEDVRDNSQPRKTKGGGGGLKAVAAGAVLVAAGRLAYRGVQTVQDQLQGGDEDEVLDDEEDFEKDGDPEAYEDEELEDEELVDPESEEAPEEDFEDSEAAEEPEEDDLEAEEQPEQEEEKEPSGSRSRAASSRRSSSSKT